MIGDVGEIQERDVNMAIDFVKANKGALVELWNEDVDPWDISFKKVGEKQMEPETAPEMDFRFESLSEMEHFGMLCAQTANTGLPMAIYISNQMRAPYGPRLRVSTRYNAKLAGKVFLSS